MKLIIAMISNIPCNEIFDKERRGKGRDLGKQEVVAEHAISTCGNIIIHIHERQPGEDGDSAQHGKIKVRRHEGTAQL
jgi:hypothetical protein